jgi:hypothetical protein
MGRGKLLQLALASQRLQPGRNDITYPTSFRARPAPTHGMALIE